MKADISLLTCVFETFRSTSHKTYILDPAYYYTMLYFTWNCMLKYTSRKLETLEDVDIPMFLERAKRRGISLCSNRSGKNKQ